MAVDTFSERRDTMCRCPPGPVRPRIDGRAGVRACDSTRLGRRHRPRPDPQPAAVIRTIPYARTHTTQACSTVHLLPHSFCQIHSVAFFLSIGVNRSQNWSRTFFFLSLPGAHPSLLLSAAKRGVCGAEVHRARVGPRFEQGRPPSLRRRPHSPARHFSHPGRPFGPILSSFDSCRASVVCV